MSVAECCKRLFFSYNIKFKEKEHFENINFIKNWNMENGRKWGWGQKQDHYDVMGTKIDIFSA